MDDWHHEIIDMIRNNSEIGNFLEEFTLNFTVESIKTIPEVCESLPPQASYSYMTLDEF